MEFYPSLQTIKEIAASGEYNVAPVSCELFSDFTTPIEVIRILKKVSAHCYMLESAKADENWGRYTFLGYEPKLSIQCKDGEMSIDGRISHTESPTESVHRRPSLLYRRTGRLFLL